MSIASKVYDYLKARQVYDVNAELVKRYHHLKTGVDVHGSWFVECMDCYFSAQGNQGGKVGIEKMTELHLETLDDQE